MSLSFIVYETLRWCFLATEVRMDQKKYEKNLTDEYLNDNGRSVPLNVRPKTTNNVNVSACSSQPSKQPKTAGDRCTDVKANLQLFLHGNNEISVYCK